MEINTGSTHTHTTKQAVPKITITTEHRSFGDGGPLIYDGLNNVQTHVFVPYDTQRSSSSHHNHLKSNIINLKTPALSAFSVICVLAFK